LQGRYNADGSKALRYGPETEACHIFHGEDVDDIDHMPGAMRAGTTILLECSVHYHPLQMQIPEIATSSQGQADTVHAAPVFCGLFRQIYRVAFDVNKRQPFGDYPSTVESVRRGDQAHHGAVYWLFLFGGCHHNRTTQSKQRQKARERPHANLQRLPILATCMFLVAE
jgi:hypothetical protein